jgi:hypothetical protein
MRPSFTAKLAKDEPARVWLCELVEVSRVVLAVCEVKVPPERLKLPPTAKTGWILNVPPVWLNCARFSSYVPGRSRESLTYGTLSGYVGRRPTTPRYTLKRKCMMSPSFTS